MGTLRKAGSDPPKLNFDGKPESWPTFKKALYQFLDKEGYGWVVEGGDAFCAMLQAASAKAAKSKGKSCMSELSDAQYEDRSQQTNLLTQVHRGRVCVFITAVPNTKLCAWGVSRFKKHPVPKVFDGDSARTALY
jgi:hypothetical protein